MDLELQSKDVSKVPVPQQALLVSKNPATEEPIFHQQRPFSPDQPSIIYADCFLHFQQLEVEQVEFIERK